MKRHLAALLALVLVVSVFAITGGTATAAKKKKKKKPAPVAVDVTYHINWGGEGCVLQLTAVDADEACVDPFAGALGEELGTGPHAMPAIEGLPLTLDAAKPIKGSISASSYYAVGVGPDVMGIGQAELYVKLVGTSAGEEIVIGELTTDPYTVTPAQADYIVEFELTPAADLTGKVLDDLTLELELRGNQMFHGVLNANGTSTLTVGASALP